MTFTRTKAMSHIRQIASDSSATEVFVGISGAQKTHSYSIQYSGYKRGAFNPDAVVAYGEKKDFYAVETELSKANMSEKIYKWILFSTEARKASGKLFIVVPLDKESQFNNLIQWKQIDAVLIAL